MPHDPEKYVVSSQKSMVKWGQGGQRGWSGIKGAKPSILYFVLQTNQWMVQIWLVAATLCKEYQVIGTC